jgi:hypothetical protein
MRATLHHGASDTHYGQWLRAFPKESAAKIEFHCPQYGRAIHAGLSSQHLESLLHLLGDPFRFRLKSITL